MSEEFDAIDELGKAAHMPPKSTRDVLIVDPGRIAELEAEVERLREAIGATIARAEHQGCNMAGCDSEWHSPVCPLGVIEPLNAALEPQS